MQNEIEKTEQEILLLNQKLQKLRSENPPSEVTNYTFDTETGKVTLLELFGNKDKLLALHNMGQGCRYCTLWADGINGFLPHLEDQFSVVLLSKDAPDLQRKFANTRNWRFKTASHKDTKYLDEQSVLPGKGNMPGIVCYVREGDKIFKKNSSVFGPGDTFCSLWSIISLGGLNDSNWTPQFNYWSRPQELDDGGQNVIG